MISSKRSRAGVATTYSDSNSGLGVTSSLGDSDSETLPGEQLDSFESAGCLYSCTRSLLRLENEWSDRVKLYVPLRTS